MLNQPWRLAIVAIMVANFLFAPVTEAASLPSNTRSPSLTIAKTVATLRALGIHAPQVKATWLATWWDVADILESLHIPDAAWKTNALMATPVTSRRLRHVVKEIHDRWFRYFPTGAAFPLRAKEPGHMPILRLIPWSGATIVTMNGLSAQAPIQSLSSTSAWQIGRSLLAGHAWTWTSELEQNEVWIHGTKALASFPGETVSLTLDGIVERTLAGWRWISLTMTEKEVVVEKNRFHHVTLSFQQTVSLVKA